MLFLGSVAEIYQRKEQLPNQDKHTFSVSAKIKKIKD